MTHSRLLASLAGAVCTVLATQVGRAEPAARAEPPPTVRLAQAGSVVYSGPGRCLLEINGRTYLAGACQIEQGSDTLRALPPNGRLPGYFGYLVFDDATQAEGYWNGEPRASRAHSRLGTMRRDGDCWVNAGARICATPAR
ncbi:hypothetical protein [Phreatobacter sp. AB_2022a]|uniref:hypothetical protein n=1 Tax=Phreatobacter sp. AB_2022a TaxID=3003134 RepID=UPI0022873833|nr:hypothetical protein [Phreatobacter sp. AB_2022a]MCZ0737655.1 hypothetical protein [Phreatobacter sp. AB_2022a]